MALTLIIGNKVYSSWSMRAWLALQLCEVPFREELIPLDLPTTHDAIRARSPSARVPALEHDGLRIWDSLAIVEYLAETFPAARLWPTDRAGRAVARAVCAEMHSGFAVMRNTMTMHLKREPAAVPRTAELDAEIERVQEMWRDCRARFGAGGPFLFGERSAADCFFAPVATRFRTYAVSVDQVARAYIETLEAWAPFAKWKADALGEAHVMERYER
jgi:glutathione S-transferase